MTDQTGDLESAPTERLRDPFDERPTERPPRSAPSDEPADADALVSDGTAEAILDDPVGFGTNLAEGIGKGIDIFATNVLTHVVSGVSDVLVETIAGGDNVWEGGDSGDGDEDDEDDGGGDTIGEYGEGVDIVDTAGSEVDPVVRIEDESPVSTAEVDAPFASDTDASDVDVGFDS